MHGERAAGGRCANVCAGRGGREECHSSLDRAGDLRKDGIRVGANKANSADHDYENDRKHDGIFGDVLTLLTVTQMPELFFHGDPPWSYQSLHIEYEAVFRSWSLADAVRKVEIKPTIY